MCCSWDVAFIVSQLDTPRLIQDTFGHPIDPANKEYYLASAFRKVFMQSQGELNLFGLGRSTMFIRSFLDKYGINVHVFRHGQYKSEYTRVEPL